MNTPWLIASIVCGLLLAGIVYMAIRILRKIGSVE